MDWGKLYMTERLRLFAIAVGLAAMLAACASPQGGPDVGTDGDEDATTTTAMATASTTTVSIVTTSTTEAEQIDSPAVDVRVSEATAAVPRSQGRSALLTVADGGSFLFTDEASGDLMARYDIETLTHISVHADGRIVERVGVLIGGPDWAVPTLSDIREYQSIVVRASDSKTAVSMDVDGTESVESVMTRAPDNPDYPELVGRTVAVGTDTGLLTRLLLVYSDGEADFASEGPVTTSVRSWDKFDASPTVGDSQSVGFVPVSSMDEAERLAGYSLPTVGFVPEGFDLVSVAHGEAPVSLIGGRNVVALTYQKAAWFVTITFRPDKFSTDPYDPNGDFGFTDSAIEYAGFRIVPAGVNHAYGQVGDVAVTIDGALGDLMLRQMIDGIGS